jgi:hypothetical protein|tara:strand:+ start:440 stop:616 length:177 start_codon:yes stop_codon:yes gene_type:complete
MVVFCQQRVDKLNVQYLAPTGIATRLLGSGYVLIILTYSLYKKTTISIDIQIKSVPDG